jgi:hypothetical protein
MEARIDEKGKYYTPRVIKDPVQAFIHTNNHLMVGQVYVRPEHRLSDALSEDHARFLPVTDVQVYDIATHALLYQSNFLLVAYHSIVMIGPLDALIKAPAPLLQHADDQ